VSRAVVIFARTPESEAAAKRLPRVRASALFRSLFAAWQRAARAAGAELLCIEQRGNTFGERLANCADDAFARGFRAVVITGIDVVPPRGLESAFRSVEAGRAVIAPSYDGGVNLIGLCHPARDLLITFAQRNRHIAARCRAYFGAVDELPVARDIDSLDDFYEALREERLPPVAVRLKPAHALRAAATITRAPPIA
jgi:glycosyltransferase A (GT-A) superfamily protein (DUF2064 family)